MPQPSPSFSRRALLLGAVAAPFFAAAPAWAAPDSKLIDDHWTRFGAQGDPDHALWAAFLKRYRVLGEDGVARVRYGAVSAPDKAALASYVAALSAATPTAMTRDAAFAYWANLYNAVTLKLVLDHYPVGSILRVMGGFFHTGPWDEKAVTVEDRRLSLNDIEHGILRPVFRDPRVHYAVNCASIGCPNLSETPFAAADLSDRLDRYAGAYVNHPRGARLDQGLLTVSRIYTWFEEDFGGTDSGVIAHLKQYARDPLRPQLDTVTRINRSEYNWSLNDA